MAGGNEDLCDCVSCLEAYVRERNPIDEVLLNHKVKDLASFIEYLQAFMDDLCTSLKDKDMAWEETFVAKIVELEADLSLQTETHEVALKD